MKELPGGSFCTKKCREVKPETMSVVIYWACVHEVTLARATFCVVLNFGIS
jgi:hypothetical protein